MDPNNKYSTKYLDVPNTPLYPFGYGLSYTTFNYGDIMLSSSTLRPGQTLTATITVTNTGKIEGTETVQLYLRDVVGSISRPVKELKGFELVELKKGETKTVTMTLTDKELGFFDNDGNYLVEAGTFKIMVGGSSDKGLESSFVLE